MMNLFIINNKLSIFTAMFYSLYKLHFSLKRFIWLFYYNVFLKTFIFISSRFSCVIKRFIHWRTTIVIWNPSPERTGNYSAFIFYPLFIDCYVQCIPLLFLNRLFPQLPEDKICSEWFDFVWFYGQYESCNMDELSSWIN